MAEIITLSHHVAGREPARAARTFYTTIKTSYQKAV